MLRPLAQSAHDPVSSMGDDSAIAPLAGRGRPLTDYLRQRFAQVTNPAIDHLRERAVMSVSTILGPRDAAFAADAPPPAVKVLPGVLVYPSGVELLAPLRLDATFTEEEGLRRALDRLAVLAENAVTGGAELLCVSDRTAGGTRAPIPSVLALSFVHTRLIASGLRTRCSLLVESDEPRDTHAIACLIGYGADAICPRLALETVAALAADDRIGGDRPSPDEAQRRLLAALEEGVLKVMSKMGISDVVSYRGARLFEAIGLDRTSLSRVPRRYAVRDRRCAARSVRARGARASRSVRRRTSSTREPRLLQVPQGRRAARDRSRHRHCAPGGGHRRHALRVATRNGRSDLYERFAALVNDRQPLEPRDLLELVPAAARVPLEEVEPVELIVRRFSGGAMSHGALSAEAHETIAIALNRLGARANSGEGGENPERFRDDRNSKIKQIASARFGVTAEYAASADELQIKIAQGSKPGEGGQIPAHKVTDEIALLRRTQPGVSLISPPPHHDIYSIEDLAQLVFDLREVNPEADVSVKLVAEHGIGLVAAGVAKAHADVIHVAGADGGTGASPLSSIKHAGAPWELGLAETQQALVANHLRGRLRLRVDGGLQDGPGHRRCSAARRRRVRVRNGASSRRGVPHGALVPSRHLPGRDRDTAAGAAREVCGHTGDGSGVPSVRRRGGSRSPRLARIPLAGRGDRQSGVSAPAPYGRPRRRCPRPFSALGARGCRPSAPHGASACAVGRPPRDLLHAQAHLALTGPALVEPRHVIANGDRAVGTRLAGAIAKSRDRAHLPAAFVRASPGLRGRASVRSSRGGSSSA